MDGAEVATKSIWLYGPSYNRHDLATITGEVTRAGAKVCFTAVIGLIDPTLFRYWLVRRCVLLL